MTIFSCKTLKKHLRGKYSRIKLIVETGTCLGEGTLKMAQEFDRVITIELNKELQEQAKNDLKRHGINNVKYLCGDSGELIKSVIKEINEPCIFYLDAHWSGDENVDWENSEWKGYNVNTAHLGEGKNPAAYEQVPLDREIDAISNNYDNYGVILIDDIDKFNKDGSGLKNRSFIGEDWSHLNLNEIRKKFGTRITDWIIINNDEQLLIFIKRMPKNEREKKIDLIYFNTVLKAKLYIREFLRKMKNFVLKSVS